MAIIQPSEEESYRTGGARGASRAIENLLSNGEPANDREETRDREGPTSMITIAGTQCSSAEQITQSSTDRAQWVECQRAAPNPAITATTARVIRVERKPAFRVNILTKLDHRFQRCQAIIDAQHGLQYAVIAHSAAPVLAAKGADAIWLGAASSVRSVVRANHQ